MAEKEESTAADRADERFALRPHEEAFIRQAQLGPNFAYHPCLFTIRLYDMRPQHATAYKECIAVEDYLEHTLGNLRPRLEQECEANFGEDYTKAQTHLVRMQLYNTKCKCFVDVSPEHVKHCASNTDLGYVRCFRVDYEKKKPDSALWEFHYHTHHEGDKIPMAVKRHVVDSVAGKTHREVVGKLLAKADWNKKAKLIVENAVVTYFEPAFHQQVDLPGLDAEVVPGGVYQVKFDE